MSNSGDPLVTVVVPNYNHARFLPRRLESVARQEFKDFELIVLDDASTDDSRDVIGRYQRDLPMRVIFNETNSGNSFAQWRRGAEMGTGKYLWIAESDDEADPRLLGTLVKILEQNPAVGLAYSQSMSINETGDDLTTCRSLTDYLDVDHWRSDFVENGRTECGNYLMFQNTIPNASGAVVRRDLFLECLDVPADVRLNGDWLTWIRVLLKSDVAFIAEPLNRFRSHQVTVRRKMPWGNQYLELLSVLSFLATEFRDDPVVLHRIKSAVIGHWRYGGSCIESKDSWKTFVSSLTLVRRLAPEHLREIIAGYTWYRLIHSRTLKPIRKLKRQLRPVTESKQSTFAPSL